MEKPQEISTCEKVEGFAGVTREDEQSKTVKNKSKCEEKSPSYMTTLGVPLVFCDTLHTTQTCR